MRSPALCDPVHVVQQWSKLTLHVLHGAAFAPLAFALSSFGFVPGMLLLVGTWAISFYNAMLLVRNCIDAEQMTNTCSCVHAAVATLMCRLFAWWHIQADLHTWTVTMRQCRYRDLARSIWGGP